MPKSDGTAPPSAETAIGQVQRRRSAPRQRRQPDNQLSRPSARLAAQWVSCRHHHVQACAGSCAAARGTTMTLMQSPTPAEPPRPWRSSRPTRPQPSRSAEIRPPQPARRQFAGHRTSRPGQPGPVQNSSGPKAPARLAGRQEVELHALPPAQPSALSQPSGKLAWFKPLQVSPPPSISAKCHEAQAKAGDIAHGAVPTAQRIGGPWFRAPNGAGAMVRAPN